MNETVATYKTCLVTVIEPGMPNRVIKIFPALHAEEKIWLDHRPGIERWAAVQQLMQRFCPRGKYVPDAAYLHTPGAKPEDVNTLLLTPEQYPVVELDGAVLEPLPPRERARLPKPEDKIKAGEDRVTKMEERMDKLTDMMGNIITALAQKQPTQDPQNVEGKRGPGRPRKEE